MGNSDVTTESGLFMFSPPDSTIIRRPLIFRSPEKSQTKIVITAATPKYSEHLTTLGNQTDRLETETQGLLIPNSYANMVTPRSSRKRQTEIPSNHRNPTKKHTRVPSWMGWNPFSKGKNWE